MAGVAAAFDPITRRHLIARGVSDGWRCLEVGAGTGTIARWLAETVGPKGRVLATDLSLDLMQGLEADNLELRRHDILTDPLPDGDFDLVHCRLVLEHLPGRLDAVARVTRALAPGGWLVIEDMTFGSQRSVGRRGGVFIGGLIQALVLLLRRNGYDAGFGGRLPLHLHRAGLCEVGAEGTQLFLVGGTPSVDWARPTLDRIRQLLLEADADLTPAAAGKAFELAPPLRGQLERRLAGLEGCWPIPSSFTWPRPS